MNTPNPSKRRADHGARLVRASVLIGLAAAVGLQMAGGDAGSAPARDMGCDASANSPFAAQ